MGNRCVKSSSSLISLSPSPRNYADSVPALITYKKFDTLPRSIPQSILKTSKHVEFTEPNRRRISFAKTEPSNRLRQYPKRSIIKNYTIVWLTTNINENQSAIDYLETMFRSCRIFTNIDDFFACILAMKDEKLVLILSEIFAEKILSFIHETSQLISIYILSKYKSQDQQWIKQYEKIQGIFTTIESICKNIQLSEPNTIPYEILNSSGMILQYLIKQYLLTETIDWKESLNSFLQFARRQYPNELHIIEEFEDNYIPSNAIWWYTRKCFLYHALTKAFRSENFEELFLMRFFIQHIHQQLNRTDEEINCINPTIVYQGQGILENDLIRIQKNQNKIFTFKNFLWTTTDENLSLSLAQSARYTRQLCGVLFRIEIPSAISLISLDKSSYYLNSKNEILLSIDSFFRIDQIKQIDEQIWQIDLILLTENDLQVQDTVEHMEGDSTWEKIGFYLIELKQYTKAEEFYQTLRQSNSINDTKQFALLHEQLGFIYHHKLDSINSLLHYKKSLKYYLNFLSPNDSSLLPIYLNIGLLLHEQKQSNEAIKQFKYALNIALNLLPYDHLQVARIHHYLARIYEDDGIFIDAIQHYQSALENELRQYPLHHLSITKTYNKIGELFYRMRDYSTAISYFDKTLKIQKKILPPNHKLLAITNYNLARVLTDLHSYKEAIEYASRAVNIARHVFGSDHDDVKLYENCLKQLRRKTLIGVIPNGSVYE